jgi:phosphoglycolate phosphatase-like HAD superfamily hydrolase
VKLLALDFDGVISDSADEALEVARRTWLELRPGSALRDADPARLRAAFLALMPLGNRAEDYATALAAIEAGVALADQPAYDAFRARQDESWLARFHERFYAVREVFSETDPEGWLARLRPYRAFVALLARRAGACEYAIATAKDRRSVGILLRHYGIAELFPEDLVLDKETGVTKTAHLEVLARRRGLDFPEITFLDDKVNHLDATAGLGIRCALAAWGYNGPREHDLARARGYLLCRLEDVERRLFGS